MNSRKVVYYVSTGLLTALMLMSAGTMLFANQFAAENFTRLGFPTYLTYFVGIAKLLGLIAIWASVPKALREWAYAGFFFNFLLAITAHLNVQDGEWAGAAVAIALLLISYFTRTEAAGVPAQEES